MKFWKNLEPGSLIDVVAPGWACSPELLESAASRLETWGFRVRIPKELLQPARFYSNSDSERARLLMKALRAPDSKAVWCVRGGSGTIRCLSAIAKSKAPKLVKPVIGYSDITALHMALMKHWKWGSVHGPVLERLGREKTEPEKSLGLAWIEVQNILSEKKWSFETPLDPLNKKAETSRIKGPLVGGNLAVFTSLVGTPFLPSVKGAVLFFEDLGERGYRIERLFDQLRAAKIFDAVAGIVFGEFIGGLETDGTSLVSLALLSLADELKVPVWQNLPVGHGQKQMPLIQGLPCTIQKSKFLQLRQA